MYNLQSLPSTEYKVVPSVADGDCLFFSLSIGLYGNANHTQLLRKQTTDHILQNIDHFRPFLNASAFFKNSLRQLHLDPFRNYVLNLRQDGIWAGVESIAAISDLYNIKVQLHQAFKTTPRVYEPSKSSDSVKLPVVDLFYDGEFHYQPITPCHRRQDAILKSPSKLSSSTHTKREPILSSIEPFIQNRTHREISGPVFKPNVSSCTKREPILLSFEPFIQSQIQQKTMETVFKPDVPVQRKREPILSSIEPFIENRTYREISGPVFKPNVSSCTKREPILSSFEPFIQSQVQQEIAEPVFKPDVPDRRKRGPILSSSEELIPYPSQQETTKHRPTFNPIIASPTKQEPILSSFEHVIPHQSQEGTHPTFRPAAPILAKREPILPSSEPFSSSQTQTEPLICAPVPDPVISYQTQEICAQPACEPHTAKRTKQETSIQRVKSVIPSVTDFQPFVPISKPSISSSTQREQLFPTFNPMITDSPLKAPLLSIQVIPSVTKQDPVLSTLNKPCHAHQKPTIAKTVIPILPEQITSVLTSPASVSRAPMPETNSSSTTMQISSNSVYGDGGSTLAVASLHVEGFVGKLKHNLLSTEFGSKLGLDLIGIQDISSKIPSEMMMEGYKLFAPMHGAHVDDDSRCGFLVANDILANITRVISPTPSITALFIKCQNAPPCCYINMFSKPKANPDANTSDSIYAHLDVIIKEADRQQIAIIFFGSFNCIIGRNDAEKWTVIRERVLYHAESDAAGLILADYVNKHNLDIVSFKSNARQCWTWTDGTEKAQTDYCFHSSRMHIVQVNLRGISNMLSSHKLLIFRCSAVLSSRSKKGLLGLPTPRLLDVPTPRTNIDNKQSCFPALSKRRKEELRLQPSLLGLPTPGAYIDTKRIDWMITQNLSKIACAQKRQRPSDD